MASERSFVMVKPDGVRRGLVGEIISRLETRGFRLVAAKFMKITKELAGTHYEEHVKKDWYHELEAFITSGPVLAMVWEGEDAVQQVRRMMGKTNPMDSDPGTIRGDFGLHKTENLVHGSDGPESAKREISLFFTDDELVR
jgi:nucleoside-diphosphate kinase